MVYVDPNNADEGDLHTGTRMCKVCTLRQPMTAFHYANRKTSRRRVCKGCCETRRKDWRAENPAEASARDRRRTLKTKYGISEDKFWEMLVDQEFSCATCHVKLTKATTHIDHDHRSGIVRGLLCFNCNVAIGHFRDNPVLMERAASYVREAIRVHEFAQYLDSIEEEIRSYELDNA